MQAKHTEEMPLKDIADKVGDAFGPTLDAIVEEQSKVSFLHSSHGVQESTRANPLLAARFLHQVQTLMTLSMSPSIFERMKRPSHSAERKEVFVPDLPVFLPVSRWARDNDFIRSVPLS